MKAVLFDLDGTLTDPREGITRCIAYAVERMGIAPPPLEELTITRTQRSAAPRRALRARARERGRRA